VQRKANAFVLCYAAQASYLSFSCFHDLNFISKQTKTKTKKK